MLVTKKFVAGLLVVTRQGERTRSTMADESPVIRHLRHFKSNNPAISDHQSDNLVSDEELSVGGTTPPPPDQRDDFPSPEALKDERDRDIDGLSEDEKDSVASATNIIKFSIDNILNPEFGRMNAAESAAAVAFHTHHQQLIQQQQQMNSSAGAAAAAGSFLGAFHQLPFLAAARQMILAATAAAGSSIDYHQHHLAAHHASVAQAITHPHPLNTAMLLAHQAQQQQQQQHNHPTTLNLVESCTDKYLGGGSNNKSWLSHQPTPSGGALSARSSSHPLSALASAAGAVGNKANKGHQLANKGQPHQLLPGSKAIDLSLRNSASPPDPLHRLTAAAEKQSAPQDSPSLPSSADDNSSASPVRSVSVRILSIILFLNI